MAEVLAFRTRHKKALTNPAALQLLRDQGAAAGNDGWVEFTSYTDLADFLKWEKTRTWRAVQRWIKDKRAEVRFDEMTGRVAIRALPDVARLAKGKGSGVAKPKRTKSVRKRGKPVAAAVDASTPEAMDNTAGSSVDFFLSEPAKSTTYAKSAEAEIPPSEAPQDAPVETAAESNTTAQVQSGMKSEEAPEPSADTAEVRAESGVPAAPAKSAERLPEHKSTSIERATERPAWRRGGGGGLTTGGGGGFDVADTFGSASLMERLLILIALGLSATAAYMSVTGMTVLYPFEPTVVVIFGSLIEAAKFVGFGVLAASWRYYGGVSRLIAASLLLVAALINAAGVYGRLISDHVGPAADRTAVYTQADAGQGAKLEVAQAKLTDIDKRIQLIDEAAEGAARRGRSRSAISAIRSQQKTRAQLADEKQRIAQEVASLKAGRTTMAGEHQATEAANTPIRHAAALFEDFGLLAPGTDPEKLIRWISFMILLTGDPLALALMWTINSRAKLQGRA